MHLCIINRAEKNRGSQYTAGCPSNQRWDIGAPGLRLEISKPTALWVNCALEH
jgi:hypothetical protein